MVQAGRTFRIFVSSTVSDLKEEQMPSRYTCSPDCASYACSMAVGFKQLI